MNDVLGIVFEHLSAITITDVVDVGIVTFAIYKVIQLIKTTRAETLVKGIFFLIIVVQCSYWFHLNTISYILDRISDLIVIGAIIVFQPELRRALEMVGRAKFKGVELFGGFEDAVKQAQMKKMVEDITTASMEMSREKTGALIVIERDTKIGDIIGTGTMINADVTSDLIRNIFFKNSPLHDGAMVIREQRITAAGCFLPLSQNFGISKQLGTRHRAGLGMSECCDAIVVIVSEETGAISIARDGQLTHNVSEKALFTILDNILCPPLKKKESKKFRMWKGKDHE